MSVLQPFPKAAAAAASVRPSACGHALGSQPAQMPPHRVLEFTHAWGAAGNLCGSCWTIPCTEEGLLHTAMLWLTPVGAQEGRAAQQPHQESWVVACRQQLVRYSAPLGHFAWESVLILD